MKANATTAEAAEAADGGAAVENAGADADQDGQTAQEDQAAQEDQTDQGGDTEAAAVAEPVENEKKRVPKRPRDTDRVKALFTRMTEGAAEARYAEAMGRFFPADEADEDAEAAADGGAEQAQQADQPETADQTEAADQTANSDADAAAKEAMGAFVFARWTKPIAPAFYGVADNTAEVMRQGFERAAKAIGWSAAAEDAELGANVLVYFCEHWSELKEAPGLDRLVPDLAKLTTVLAASGANQYRLFHVDREQGVKLAVVLLRVDEELDSLPPQVLALGQAAQILLMWSDEAFLDSAPVTIGRQGRGLLKRWHQRLLEAAYAEETPAFSDDPALAEELAARMNAPRRNRRKGGRERAEESDAAQPASEGAEAEAQSAVDAAPVEPSAEAPSEATEAAEQASHTDEASQAHEASGTNESGAQESDAVKGGEAVADAAEASRAESADEENKA